MFFSDITFIIQWWLTFFLIGIVFLPLTFLIFNKFFDKGYIFSKIIGIALISYASFVLGFLKLLPFQTHNLFLIVGIFIAVNIFIVKKFALSNIKFKSMLLIFVIEEFIFILILLLWSFIHAHQPEIHGLEKYMDFGFINSVLRSEYFPPKDMWFTPFYINYYYFGHLVTAVLTKLSLLPSSITFNLMLATIAAISFTASFSIGANLIHSCIILSKRSASKNHMNYKKTFFVSIGGLVTAFILNFTGSLHTIYLFFKPYQNEYPVPFWQLVFSQSSFPNSYWYPNATRFIENTIHEFPLYSYVVSDLHGHVLDIPFVLLTIAILLSLINPKHEIRSSKQIQNINVQNSKRFGNFNFGYLKLFRISNLEFRILLLGFILAIMYMTNAWDGIIYFALSALIILYITLKSTNHYSDFKEIKNEKSKIKNLKLKIYKWLVYLFIIGVGFFLFSLPFNLNFKPFTSGIGILCAPEFLTNIGKLGPFLFEKDHCQHSPFWQLFILYGFFYFWIISFIVFLKIKYQKLNIKNLPASDIFIFILIILSTLLIIIPEFIYVKDIYPAHYRANTMFKLVYQAFIMLSLASAYISVCLILNIKNQISKMQIKNKIFNFCYVYLLFAILFFILVFMYPYFSINSYFGNLKSYHGLDGAKYLKPLYPNDYEAILWINKNIKGQPVILEAQGDSYTDYGRVSANTGLPTVLGWTVHEWLWRGTYDVPSPRIEDVKSFYETGDIAKTKELIKKHDVKLVFIGSLEKEKYPNLNEEKFKALGRVIYQNGDTKIYKIFF